MGGSYWPDAEIEYSLKCKRRNWWIIAKMYRLESDYLKPSFAAGTTRGEFLRLFDFGDFKVPGAELNEQEFVRLVLSHRVPFIVSERIAEARRQMGPDAPNWMILVIEKLRIEIAAYRLRWVVLSKAAEELAAALEGTHLPAVFLKGYAYARELYASPEQRPFNDLDILVRKADVERVGQVLYALGFAPSDKPIANGAIEKSFYKTIAPGFVVDVDLHWDLIGRESLNREMRLDPEKFIERSLDRGQGIRVLSPEDAMIFAAVNLVVHGYSPLQQFYDIKLMTERPLDWDLLLERARECRVRSALSAGLTIASELFGAEIPKQALRELRLPWWQRMTFKRLLKLEHLIRPERYMEFGARYGLKVLSQDTLGAVFRTLLYAPWGFLKRKRMNGQPIRS